MFILFDLISLFTLQMPDDAVMLRFLRARDCNLEKVFFAFIQDVLALTFQFAQITEV